MPETKIPVPVPKSNNPPVKPMPIAYDKNGMPDFSALDKKPNFEPIARVEPLRKSRLRTILKYSFWIVVLAGISYHYFYYWDPGQCGIGIPPSLLNGSNLGIKRALATMKRGSPEDYQAVCRHVGTINPNPSCGGILQGGCFSDLGSKRGSKHAIEVSGSGDDEAVMIFVIRHEACHAVQYDEQRPFNEEECYDAGNQVVQKITEY